MFTQLKKLGAKSKLAIICWHIYDNWEIRRRFRTGKLAFTSGSTHTGMILSESLRYIDSVFDDYLTFFASMNWHFKEWNYVGEGLFLTDL